MFGTVLRRSSPRATALTRDLHGGLAVRLAEVKFGRAEAGALAGAPSSSLPTTLPAVGVARFDFGQASRRGLRWLCCCEAGGRRPGGGPGGGRRPGGGGGGGGRPRGGLGGGGRPPTVRSTGADAMPGWRRERTSPSFLRAGVPAQSRRQVRGVVREPVDGEAVAGDAAMRMGTARRSPSPAQQSVPVLRDECPPTVRSTKADAMPRLRRGGAAGRAGGARGRERRAPEGGGGGGGGEGGGGSGGGGWGWGARRKNVEATLAETRTASDRRGERCRHADLTL